MDSVNHGCYLPGCNTYLLGPSEVWQLDVLAVNYKICEASVFEKWTMLV